MKSVYLLITLDVLVTSSLLSSRRNDWLHQALLFTLDACSDSKSARLILRQMRRIRTSHANPLLEQEAVLRTRELLAGLWHNEIERRALAWDTAGAQRVLEAASRSCAFIADYASYEVGVYHEELNATLRIAKNEESFLCQNTAFELDHLPDQTLSISIRQLFNGLIDSRCVPFPEPSQARVERIRKLLNASNQARIAVLMAEQRLCDAFERLSAPIASCEEVVEDIGSLSDVD